MLFTLSYIREKLWTVANQTVAYSSASQAQKDEVDFRINQVIERFLTEGKWKFTLRRVTIPIHSGYVTLPRELGSLIGIKLLSDSGCCCVSQLYTKFHEFAHGVPSCCSTGTYSVSETAQTFLVPDAPFTLRVKSTVASGTIKFIGGWDTDDEEFFGADTVNIPNGSADGTMTYNSLPAAGGIQKSITTVPVELYSVSSTGVETLIAVYGPHEEVPAYKKYKVPEWNNTFTSALVFGKLAYVPLVDDTDVVVPSNIGALKYGLKALQSEDTEEDEHADQDWARAYRILNGEVNETDTDAEFPMWKVAPEFGAGNIVSVM